MSDFFMPTQEKDYTVQNGDEKKNKSSIFTSDTWLTTDEEFQKQKQQRLENRQRYGVNVPDQIYEVFNQMTARCNTPEEANELSYKLGSACRYMEMMGKSWDDFQDIFDNVDNYNAAQFPNLQDQKSRFEALSDSLTIGKSNVKLGELGQKLMKAHRENDTELAKSLMAEINAINQQNVLMADNVPRHLFMQELEAGAQSLPFTGAAAAAGIFGNFIVPGAGTAASFAVSSYLATGSEYVDMIANGSSPETARGIALASGVVQGIIEADLGITKGIVKGSARLMGKEITESIAQKKLKEIENKALKKFHFGPTKRLLLNYVERRGGDVLGEGAEELFQEMTSTFSKEMAAVIDGYDIPDDDAKHIVKNLWESFKGGVLGALGLGFIPGMNPARLEAYADIHNVRVLRDSAEIFSSEEVFKKAQENNPIFDGLSKEDKAQEMHDVWQAVQDRMEEKANAEAQNIAEGLDAGEGAQERKTTTDENGNVIEEEADPVARDKAGRLYTSDEVSTDDNGNVTGGTFIIGDKTKSEANRYGYINYETAENGDITITDFKLNKDREGLRGEVFEEFAREHPDVNIEWNAIGSQMQDAKQKLIDENPNGSKNGLRYYTSESLNDIQTKKALGRAIREKFHNIKAVKYFDENNQAKIRYDKTQLTSGQVASVIALFDTMAQKNKQSLSAFLDQKFVKGVFGTTSEMQADVRAYNQKHVGEQVDENKVTGGFIWKNVEQGTRAIIYAAENADYLTLMHELAHFYQSTLTGDLKAEAEAAFDVQNGDWSAQSKWKGDDGKYMSKYEAFAYHFQDWLTTGRVKNETWKNVFEKFAQFLAQAYTRLKNHLAITPEIESVFEKMLGDDKSIMAKALKAAQEEEGEYRAMLKRDAEAKEAQKKTEAEEAKRQAEAEREEASEGTDFEESAELTPEQAEAQLQEAENETTEENNAIDDALENLNLADDKKAEIAETLKDETSTVVEKAEAATEAASSVYDDEEDVELPDMMFQMTFQEAQKHYPNIVDITDAFNKKPTKEDLKDYIQKLIGKEIVTFDTSKKIVVPQNRNKRKHIVNSSRYEVLQRKKNINEKERHDAYVLSAEDLMSHATYKEPGKNSKPDKKRNIAQYHIFNVPVYVDGHGYNVRIDAEEKKSSVAQPQKESETRAQNTAQQDNNISFDKLQVVDLYDFIEEDMLFQIAGEIGAENLDNSEVQEGVNRMQNLAIAKQMETDGKDAKAIRLATGWEKGADGKWRWEIDDSKIKTDFEDKALLFRKKNPRYGELEEKLKSLNYDWEKLSKEEQEEFDKLGDLYSENYGRNKVVLMDILDAPELFRAYPIFKEMPIEFKTRDYSQNYEAQLVEGTVVDTGAPYFKIEFNGTPNSYNSEKFKSTLLHELQHAIQRIEGFAKGGSLESAVDYIEKENQKKAEIKNKAFAWEWKIELEKQEEKYPELKGNLALMNSLIDEYTENGKYPIKELEDEHWLPERNIRDKGFNLYVRGYDKEGFEEAYKEWQEKAGKKGVTVFNPTKDTERNRFNYYKRFAGETESRNVQTRMNFTPEERREALLAATEDVDRDDQIMLFQTVYHGSGADFDKFDTENYGLSGEGSMSFGYGTYVADDEEIARDYAQRQYLQKYGTDTRESQLNSERENLARLEESLKEYESKEVYEAKTEQLKKDLENATTPWRKKVLTFALDRRSEEERVSNLEETKAEIEKSKKTIEALEKEIADIKANSENAKRHLYTVEIPDTGYIVWDKTVPKAKRMSIMDKLYKKLIKEDYAGAEVELRRELIPVFEAPANGKELYQNIWSYLGSDKDTSQFLRSIGITGINYPAGTNYGTPNGKEARNYVIFNDDDAQIVDHLLFQTQAELMDEARTFETWQEFMEYCELFHSEDEVSPIPSDSDAQWYQSFWEQSKGVQTEQEKNEQAVDEKNKREGNLPTAVDALFSTFVKTDPEILDNFLQAVSDIDAIDLDSPEWAQAGSEEDARERDRIDQLKDFINITLSDYNWQTALKRIQGGHEIAEGLRKRLIGEMTDGFKVRDFRALYAEIMGDEQYAVSEEDSITATLNKKLRKYHDIVKPSDDISRWSPERRKQLAEQLQNREIAEKIKNGSLKLDDELDSYIKSLTKQIKDKQKQFDELEAETKADYQRIADAERRKLLKLHEELLLARSKMRTKDAEIERKIKKGLKITEKYGRESQNLTASYEEVFRKYSDLKDTITITAEVQAALDRQEQLAGLREDLNSKQKEKNLTAEVKKMRIQLVKRAMRRVPFNRIDYENAKTVIAIQRMLEPNLLGGVNRFIGIDNTFLRGVISQIITDSEYKEKILNYLRKNTKASQAFADFKKKLEELKSIKDFDSWTAKDRKAAIRYLPKENWVRDLNLKELATEREESIDLDIGTEEYSRPVYDEKTGEPKTYKDKEGMEHNVTETAFRLKFSDEIGRMVLDAVGADMYDRIVNKPFSEWTTEELEEVAKRIDELYTEGRNLKAAKDEARKKAADAIRKRIEDAIKETGITINDDDTPEEKERKQKQIDKILGMSEDLKGTEAAKTKGFKAKITRLLHSYSDMNVLRFARMLDGQSEGENYRMLYRMEDDCYNAKQRSMNARAEKINKVMKDNKITEGDLAKTVKVSGLGTEFAVDELLYFLAADKDYEEDEKKVQRGLFGIDANDDFAATSRNAVMFGNMMSDMMSQEEKESWLKMDKDLEEALKNGTLTQEQKEAQAMGNLDTKPGTTRYIAACHAKWEVVLGAANSYLNEHPEFKALMEAIEEDYASQYERMNEVSINEFNMPVHRVKAYVPLVRRESNGDTNVNQVKEDLLGAYGAEAGKQWVNKGMTQRRVNISPLNQKPVQTGLFRTWGDSIERTEHFIAYSPYVRQLNAVYKSRDASYTRRFIEGRYGKSALEYLDAYINEVANPNAGRIRERGAEWLHVLRGKTAPAYLGWKASGIIKQGLTSPWPYMQFVNPAEYVAAAMKFTFNPEMREAIKEKSVFMKMRRMDPVNDLIDEMADNAKSKLDRGWNNFTKLGMQGLELIDWACVAPGWLACYEKKYNQLQKASNARYEAKMAELKERNMTADIGTTEYLTPEKMEAQARKEMTEDIELEAVRYADDCTRACQPSNRVTDLAPLFKNSSEAMKAFLQFQTSLNVIWQNIRYDLPYAVKNKEFTRIAGTIIGYVMAGIFMNSVMEGVAGDDDDDETQALRNLIYYSTTQFTDAIPIMGSEITNTMDQLITGKRGFAQSGTDMTPSATKLLSVLTTAQKGNWEKAARLTAEGIGLYLGAPVSGTKEIYKLLGSPLKEGDVNLARGVGDVYGLAGDIIGE